MERLEPVRSHGWTWPDNGAGMHLLLRHRSGASVRRVAAASSLALALLSTYRTTPSRDDGLFLRFGALGMAALRAGAEELLAAISATKLP
ncbi:MAG TPA: hypothetical protein VLV78_20865 [Thermoanaerobaculia bacterium]|nr:hypothetical protein [Thermoanaerobaculia bacterium]